MKDPHHKTVVMSEVMPPERANFTGHIHGGYIMLLMDRAAYACAARYSKKDVVTVTVDEIVFKQPIYLGELVTFYACINYVGNTSMEVGIKVTAENVKTGEVRHTNSCYATMVAIDDNGKPSKIEPLVIETDADKRRFREATTRKEIRKELQERYKSIKAKKN